jgi:hypothetical protein
MGGCELREIVLIDCQSRFKIQGERYMRAILVGFIMLSTMQAFSQIKGQASESSAPNQSVHFQPLNVRTGLWQNALTTTTGGDSMIPANLLSRLSPERRAKMEAAMKERAAENGHTVTYQSCVTSEELKEMPFADKQNCTETLLNSSSTEAQINFVCTMDEFKAKGTMQIHATSTTSVQGSGSGTATGNGQSMNITSTLSGHWLKADCGDVK